PSRQSGSRAPNDVAGLSMMAWHLVDALMTSRTIPVRILAIVSRHFAFALSPPRSTLPRTSSELPPIVSSMNGFTAPVGLPPSKLVRTGSPGRHAALIVVPAFVLSPEYFPFGSKAAFVTSLQSPLDVPALFATLWHLSEAL